MRRKSSLHPGDPFLKWAGGKRSVLPHLLPEVPGAMGAFHEPFVGGGALFFALAAQRPGTFRRARLADQNERLVRCYRAIRDDVEAVIGALRGHADAHGEEHFYRVRKLPIDGGSDVDVAAWLLYLNRTAFNGLYRVNSKGTFNVPFGAYDEPNICQAEHLRACARLLHGVSVEHAPFEAVEALVGPGDVVYFDPPYQPKSTTAFFTAYTREGFGPDDQRRLRDVAAALAERGARVILSNHDTPETRALYDEARFVLEVVPVARRINSKASARGAVDELVIVARQRS